MRLTILLSTTFAMALAVLGCGGDDTGEPADTTCYDYSSFDGMSPTVSFKTDVMPIFQTSCTFSGTCHGTTSGATGKIYLGPMKGTEPTDMDLSEIISMNVNEKASTGVTTIVPGEPQKSFLMHKMDGTFSCADITCEGGCGTLMPQGSTTPLPVAQRDTVRRWIAQGAKNN